MKKAFLLCFVFIAILIPVVYHLEGKQIAAVSTTPPTYTTTTAVIPKTPEERKLFHQVRTDRYGRVNRTIPTTTTTTTTTAPPRARVASAKVRATVTPSAVGDYATMLECIRGPWMVNGRMSSQESGGNYQNKSNRTYRGAYQFSYPTWNGTARAIGRHDLVGVDPADASVEDQDQMAIALYERNKTRPTTQWPMRDECF